MYEQSHEQPRGEGERAGFAGPRLQLPRFQFAPVTAAPAPAPQQAAPTPQFSAPTYRPAAPMPSHAPVTYAAPQPLMQPQHHAPQHQRQQQQLTYATAPAPMHAPMPTYNATATAIAQPVQVSYAPAAPAPAPVVASAAGNAMALANATRPVTVSWDRLEAPASERTLLQKITPVHMGVLLVMVIMAMVVTSGPASMKASPSLSALTVSGGGTSGPVGTNPVAVDALAPSTKAVRRARANAVATAPRASFVPVGSARVSRSVRAGGIPSPAAAANLAISGGGRVATNSTGAVRMDGIPSPAAAEKLGPQTLPYRPTDGVTLPRSAGERDSHALDTHYGASELPMEAPVTTPAMTPGAAAAQAEHQVVVNDLAGGSAPAPNAAGGLLVPA